MTDLKTDLQMKCKSISKNKRSLETLRAYLLIHWPEKEVVIEIVDHIDEVTKGLAIIYKELYDVAYQEDDA